MRLFALPSSVARHLMMGTAFTVVGVTSWFTYQKVFMRNPMRMRKDAEGVWHWMTYEEHLEDRLQYAHQKLASSPENQAYRFMTAGYAASLEQERRRVAAEGAPKKELSDDDLKL